MKVYPEIIITYSNMSTKQMFFSNNDKQNIDKQWIVCTTSLPVYVGTRPNLSTGWVRTQHEYIKIFGLDYEIIPNPEPEYQA